MKRLRRGLAATLAGALLITAAPFGASAASFADTRGHWAESSVERWAEYGTVQGSGGRFQPDSSMTRAEMATILTNLLGLHDTARNTFADVPSGAWYEDAILKCAAAGILKGDGHGANPNSAITREEATVMLARALGIEEASGSVTFSDGTQVSNWSRGYIRAMVDKGIINGVGGNRFAPLQNIDRAAVVTILDRSISTYANRDGATVSATGSGITLIAAEDVTLTGRARGDVLVAPGARSSKLTLDGAQVDGTLRIQARNVALSLTDDADVSKINVTEDDATIDVGKNAKIRTINVSADDALIKGSGKVTQLNVLAGSDNAKITTSGTKISVDKNAGKVATRSGSIQPGRNGSSNGSSRDDDDDDDTKYVSGISVAVDADTAESSYVDWTNTTLGNEISISGNRITGTLKYNDTTNLWAGDGNHFFIWTLNGLRSGDTVTVSGKQSKSFTADSTGKLVFLWAKETDSIAITVARKDYVSYKTTLDLSGLVELPQNVELPKFVTPDGVTAKLEEVKASGEKVTYRITLTGTANLGGAPEGIDFDNLFARATFREEASGYASFAIQNMFPDAAANYTVTQKNDAFAKVYHESSLTSAGYFVNDGGTYYKQKPGYKQTDGDFVILLQQESKDISISVKDDANSAIIAEYNITNNVVVRDEAQTEAKKYETKLNAHFAKIGHPQLKASVSKSNNQYHITLTGSVAIGVPEEYQKNFLTEHFVESPKPYTVISLPDILGKEVLTVKQTNNAIGAVYKTEGNKLATNDAYVEKTQNNWVKFKPYSVGAAPAYDFLLQNEQSVKIEVFKGDLVTEPKPDELPELKAVYNIAAPNLQFIQPIKSIKAEYINSEESYKKVPGQTLPAPATLKAYPWLLVQIERNTDVLLKDEAKDKVKTANVAVKVGTETYKVKDNMTKQFGSWLAFYLKTPVGSTTEDTLGLTDIKNGTYTVTVELRGQKYSANVKIDDRPTVPAPAPTPA